MAIKKRTEEMANHVVGSEEESIKKKINTLRTQFTMNWDCEVFEAT